MAQFRVTIRHGDPRPRYEVLDVEASGLAEALRQVAARIPTGVDATADLAEVRRQRGAEDREYTPG